MSLVANVGLIPVSMPCLHQSFSSIFAALFALLLWRPRGYHDNGTWLRRERRSTSILIRGREAARQLLLHVHVMESFEKPLHRRRATIHDHWFSKCSQIEAMNKPRVVVPTTTSSFVSSSSDCNFYVAKSPIRFTLEKNLKPEIFQKKKTFRRNLLCDEWITHTKFHGHRSRGFGHTDKLSLGIYYIEVALDRFEGESKRRICNIKVTIIMGGRDCYDLRGRCSR